MAFTIFSKNSGSQYINIANKTSPSLNVWENYVLTYNANGSTSGMKMWKNGVLQTVTATTTGTYVAMLGSSSNNLEIAGIWNRVLSTPEIIRLNNGGNGLKLPFGGISG